MNLSERVDAYRQAFARGPVGKWSTSQGSFDVMMSEEWEFLPSGFLKIAWHSVLSGTSEELFRWRSVGDFRLELGFLPDPEDPLEPDDLDPADEPWTRVEYEFVILEHDAGREVVMRQVNARGFWTSPRAPPARP